ncbi:hypothetical protein L1887_19106 [Cichorium endivia]|nr:hypothetical protein L1887_19106 [Cichorium endivia]
MEFCVVPSLDFSKILCKDICFCKVGAIWDLFYQLIKPRLKWTPDLHERFIEAVNQLGGADKATPKSVLKLLGIQDITLYYLKSHIRLSKNLYSKPIVVGQIKSVRNPRIHFAKISVVDMVAPVGDAIDDMNGADHMTSSSGCPQTNKNLQISEAIQMQIEVQRRLHEQVELQKETLLNAEVFMVQLFFQTVLEKAQESLERQNLGIKDVNQPTDCSTESCLSYYDGIKVNTRLYV